MTFWLYTFPPCRDDSHTILEGVYQIPRGWTRHRFWIDGSGQIIWKSILCQSPRWLDVGVFWWGTRDYPCSRWKARLSMLRDEVVRRQQSNVTDGADLKIDADNVYVHKFLPFKVHRCCNVQEKLIMLYGRGGNAIGLDMNPYAMLCTKCTKPKKPAICHICELLTGWAEYIRRDTCLFLKAAKQDSYHIADLTRDQYQCNQGERLSVQALAQYKGCTCHIQKRWVGANDTVWGYFLLWKPNLLRVTAVIRDWTKWSSLVVIMVIDREYLTADRYIVK